MNVSSTVWDKFAAGASVLFGVAVTGCILSLFITESDFFFPPAIGLIAFLPLFFVYVIAVRSVVTIDENGITGLSWGKQPMAWRDIASAHVQGNMLCVIPRSPKSYIRSPHMIRFRPGVPKDALVAVIDPAKRESIESALQHYLANSGVA